MNIIFIDGSSLFLHYSAIIVPIGDFASNDIKCITYNPADTSSDELAITRLLSKIRFFYVQQPGQTSNTIFSASAILKLETVHDF